MSAQNRRVRLLKERKQLLLDPIPDVNVTWPENSINEMNVEITAPEDSIYHDDIFEVHFSFDNGYPFHAPRVTMKTPIFHPNIDNHGAICVVSLRRSFNGTVNIRQIIEEIILALRQPNPNDQLNIAAATMMKSDPQKFEATVREQVTKNCLQRESI
ncbi:hypothetical protein M9Y10_039467 [Tritrichomonas musculus]|uniref:UBC core domain-containing protein n=1 Tax=Tritrichomonas musculus TaxID=1915356 RepID=A0ABR2KBA4_9EUKA